MSPNTDPENEVLFTLAELGWNRLRSGWSSLQDVLRDNRMSFESTPIGHYPPAARECYGAVGADRASLLNTMSFLIGRGTLNDHERCRSLLDQYMERNLSAHAMIAELRELHTQKRAQQARAA